MMGLADRDCRTGYSWQQPFHVLAEHGDMWDWCPYWKGPKRGGRCIRERVSKGRVEGDVVRQRGRGDEVFLDAVSHFNISTFKSLTGVTAIKFEELYWDVALFINRPIKVKLSRSKEEMELKQPRKKAFRSHTLFFSFGCIIGIKDELVTNICLLKLEYHQQWSAHTSGMWKMHCLTGCTKINTLRYDDQVRWKDMRFVD